LKPGSGPNQRTAATSDRTIIAPWPWSTYLSTKLIAKDRPGWLWYLGEVSERFHGREMFDQFRTIHSNGGDLVMASPIMKYFSYEHLPQNLQLISQPIAELAERMEGELPDSAEISAGLRNHLETKHCFVRAKLG
jgi:hypothetical protein